VAKNQRYLLVGGDFNLPQLVSIIARHFPALAANLPSSEGPMATNVMKFDTSKIKAELGMEFIGFEQVVVDTIRGVLELQKRLEGGGGDSA